MQRLEGAQKLEGNLRTVRIDKPARCVGGDGGGGEIGV